MDDTAAAPGVRYSRVESETAHTDWGANCGPHALAAALGMSLGEVRRHLGHFKGWMSPTMMGAALRSIDVPYILRKGLKTPKLCEGINRLQWEGPWLDRGVPVAAAYQHTHWVAHRNGLVLCTVIDTARWLPVDRWRARLRRRGVAWHATHHYAFSGFDLR